MSNKEFRMLKDDKTHFEVRNTLFEFDARTSGLVDVSESRCAAEVPAGIVQELTQMAQEVGFEKFALRYKTAVLKFGL